MLCCADALVGTSIRKLFCSPLERCLQSAEIIGKILNIPVEVEPDLIEIDLGSWDGLVMETIRRQFPEDFAARGRDLAAFRPPGGESFRDVESRVMPVFKKICQIQEETAAVIAHAGVNRVTLCHILGIPLQNLFRLGQDHGCINIIDCSRDPIRCRLLNWTTECSRFQSGRIP